MGEINEWELYDLKTDPTEMHNLAASPQHAELLKQLKSRLTTLQLEAKDDIGNRGDKPRAGFPIRN